MPKLVSEISSGHQFSRSSTDGKLADSQVRVFRILLNAPGEVVNAEEACGISIGDPHPVNTNIYCDSWDIKFEGDSRLVFVATFNYRSTASASGDGQNDGNGEPPDIRPANWSLSTSLVEAPTKTWIRIDDDGLPVLLALGNVRATAEPCTNPAGDLYDGVYRLDAVVTITIEQFEPSDPTRYCRYAGCVNEDTKRIGTLECKPGTLMFRGLQARPSVKAWGRRIYRGWDVSYEFSYRANRMTGLTSHEGGVALDEQDVGWDLAVPQSGFNVKCDVNAADVEKSGMPLKHTSGKIDGWKNNVSLPTNVAVGDKARGMVLVHEYESGGASQLPCAQPIPLNDDGTPRDHTLDPPVFVKRYRTNASYKFADVFANIRLE